MCLSGEYLYIGISCGHLLVLDASTLAPAILLSCHEGPVKFVIPVAPFHHHHLVPDLPDSSIIPDHQSEVAVAHRFRFSRPTVVTLGKGFNDLVGGYGNSPSRFTGQERLGWYILLWNMEYFNEDRLELGNDFLDGIVRKKSRSTEV